VNRSKERRTKIIAWIISALVVISMTLSMAGMLVTPRRQITPTPAPTLTPFPTWTPTPTAM
jgi:hypothetical protein